MRRIVLPLVETERSLLALQYVKRHFPPAQAELILVMVEENMEITATREEEENTLAVLDEKLDVIGSVLSDYQVVYKSCLGKAGQCIVKIAREYNADYVVMTKSAQPDMLSMVGKTTEYVINNSPCNVLIVSENKIGNGEYRGLIYRKAQAKVDLRGQIGDKQSECLLPSVNADCIYHFDVTVGKIRFFHTAYNPETGNWDLPPAGEQDASVDIAAGETADILVKANSIDGKADRIRIINRGMKQVAIFTYKITVAPVTEEAETLVAEAPAAEESAAPAIESVHKHAPEPVFMPKAKEAVDEAAPVVEAPEAPVIESVHKHAPEAVFRPMVKEVVEEVAPVVETPVFETPATEIPADPESIPVPEEELTTDTIERDFDELFKKFRTAQMEYVEENPIEIDDYL